MVDEISPSVTNVAESDGFNFLIIVVKIIIRLVFTRSILIY